MLGFLRRSCRFNPHPVFRPGDARTRELVQHARLVSIRTRSFDRVMRTRRCAPTCTSSSFNPHPVFRPGDARRQPAHPPRPPGFNPHPVFRPGDAGDAIPRPGQADRFNPHPVFRPGDACLVRQSVCTYQVSIRTRSFDRVMPSCHVIGFAAYLVSIRTRSFDRVMLTGICCCWCRTSFQSAPGLSTG